jgi:hypothetical protein
MDSETLTYILKQGHLDMKTRIERGIWPHPPLKSEDVLSHLVKILETEKWFPHDWEPSIDGKPVKEGGVIEKRSPKEYIYRAQRSSPSNPKVLAEQIEKKFKSAKEVADFYLKHDLELPGDLDGWKVIK